MPGSNLLTPIGLIVLAIIVVPLLVLPAIRAIRDLTRRWRFPPEKGEVRSGRSRGRDRSQGGSFDPEVGLALIAIFACLVVLGLALRATFVWIAGRFRDDPSCLDPEFRPGPFTKPGAALDLDGDP